MANTAEVAGGQMTVEAAMACTLGQVELVRFAWEDPIDHAMGEREEHVIDMCLTPRPRGASANFCRVWPSNRYERIGNVLVVPGQTAGRAKAGAGVQRSLICRLSPSALDEWFDGEHRWTDRLLAASVDVSRSEVRTVLDRIAGELARPGMASETMMELLTAQLAIELGRYYAAVPQTSMGGLSPWRLRLIDERLAEGGAPPTLAELAALVGLSTRQLTRGFRASRDMSIGTHIERRRIDNARTLLQGDLGLKEIAHRMGFASPSAFSYAFRNATGQSPRQFRQRERTGSFTHAPA